MIGRGAIADPAVFRKTDAGSSDGQEATAEELLAFTQALEESYGEILSGETPVLFRMKEIWSYLVSLFPEEKKRFKKLMKSRTLAEFRRAETELILSRNG